jgi:hypothetical protein
MLGAVVIEGDEETAAEVDESSAFPTHIIAHPSRLGTAKIKRALQRGMLFMHL